MAGLVACFEARSNGETEEEEEEFEEEEEEDFEDDETEGVAQLQHAFWI